MIIHNVAAKAELDPVEFCLRNPDYKKMIAAIEALKANFAFTLAKSSRGRRIGIGYGTVAGTWMALMIEVKADKPTGKVQAI